MGLYKRTYTHICIRCTVYTLQCSLNANGVRHGACYQINKRYSVSIIIPSLNTQITRKKYINILRELCVDYTDYIEETQRTAMFASASTFSPYAWLKNNKRIITHYVE